MQLDNGNMRQTTVSSMRHVALLAWIAITLVPDLRLVRAAESVRGSRGSPLAAAVPNQGAVRAGGDAQLKVEVSNRSDSDIVLTDQSDLRSYDFQVRTPAGGASHAGVVAGVHDTKRGRMHCPEDGRILLLRPGQKNVRIIAVPVPSGTAGTVRVELGLRFFRIADSVRCWPVEPIDVTATGNLTVSQSRTQ
jgi:hypothetical protein